MVARLPRSSEKGIRNRSPRRDKLSWLRRGAGLVAGLRLQIVVHRACALKTPAPRVTSRCWSGGRRSVNPGKGRTGKLRCRSKVGKSILATAQSGRPDAVVRWWEESGIPYAYEQGVSKLASTYGNCNVLAIWRDRRG